MARKPCVGLLETDSLRVIAKSVGYKPDPPQFREGNPYLFNENPYQSVSFIYASIYRENVHVIHIAMQFANKSRHGVIKIDNQQQRTKIGALLHVARQSD